MREPVVVVGVAEADEEGVCRAKTCTPLGCKGTLSDNLLLLRLPPTVEVVLADTIVGLGGGDIGVHAANGAPSGLMVRAGDIRGFVWVAPAKEMVC